MVVGVQSPEQTLGQKQSGHHQKIPGRGALGGGKADFVGWPEGEFITFGVGAVPAQQIVAADKEKQQSGSAEQGDQAQNAPQQCVRRGRVGRQRLGRPVIGVGIYFTGALGG